MRFLSEVPQTRSDHWEHIPEDKQAGAKTTKHGRSSHHHCSSLHFLSNSPLDAGKYTVPPQVGNLDSRPDTTPVSYRLLLESGRDISPAARVPSPKRRTSVACVRSHPSAEERLIRWNDRLTDMRVQPVTLGEFIGREGSYFLNRKQGEERIFSFEDPILSLTQGHILGENPPSSGYQPHPSNVRSLEDAQELHLTDFVKIATGLEGYIFPPTLNRSAIATLLVVFTPSRMMQAVVACLLATGVLPNAPTFPPDWEQEGLSCEAFDNIRNTYGGIDETSIQEEFQNPTTESNLAPIKARVVTRNGEQRILQSDRSPTLQESIPPPPTAPPGEMTPPLTPVAPPPRARTRKQKDQDTPDPTFPNQATATATDTALSQGEHRGSYLFR